MPGREGTRGDDLVDLENEGSCLVWDLDEEMGKMSRALLAKER